MRKGKRLLVKIFMLESWGRCSNYLLHWCIRFFGSKYWICVWFHWELEGRNN